MTMKVLFKLAALVLAVIVGGVVFIRYTLFVA